MKSYKQTKKELLKELPNFREKRTFKPGFQLAYPFIEKRIQLGLTQIELAKRLKTSQSAIARFEAGETNPTVRFLCRLADALEAEIDLRLR